LVLSFGGWRHSSPISNVSAFSRRNNPERHPALPASVWYTRKVTLLD
jgi:hypothetical protein